jgi:hypothetical protein
VDILVQADMVARQRGKGMVRLLRDTASLKMHPTMGLIIKANTLNNMFPNSF